MRKSKKLLNDGPEEIVLDSGVKVRVSPFPAGLYEKVQAKSFVDFPDPIPPKKIIKVVDGEEEVDDLHNAEYLAEKDEVERKRNTRLGEAVYDICVEVIDMEKWEGKIKRLEKHQGPFPEDPDDRQLEFLTSFAMSTAGDYEKVTTSAISQTMIKDPEVAERLDQFQNQVERASSAGAQPSGPNDTQRLGIQSTLPRA